MEGTGTFKVAVIGSGPAGLYTAAELIKRSPDVRVDVLEKLPVPFGLVRFGVSPDHGPARGVARHLGRILEDPRVRFLGGVEIGSTLKIAEILPCYSAVVIATGAEVDRRLPIPGADLPGCHTSLEFVGWVNGHPDFANRPIPLSTDTAVIVGNGNVALDVVRLLTKDPDDLAETDINPLALEALRHSGIRTLHIIGRRGPAQASFTYAELNQIRELHDCSVTVDPAAMELNEASETEVAGDFASAMLQRQILDLLREMGSVPAVGKPKRVVFQFLKTPARIEGKEKVERIVLEKNRLAGRAYAQKPEPTGETETLPCGLVVKCIGHRGNALPGVPFDETSGTIPTMDGRVMEGNAPVPGLYAAGWIERGARGLIGHNKPDAKRTVESLLSDVEELERHTTSDITDLLKAKGIR